MQRVKLLVQLLSFVKIDIEVVLHTPVVSVMRSSKEGRDDIATSVDFESKSRK